MNSRRVAAVCVDLLIVAVACACAALTYHYVENRTARILLYCSFAVAVAGILIWEICCFVLARGRKRRGSAPSSLVLLGEREHELQVWQLEGRTGLLVGKSKEDILADVDLTHSEWNEEIDPAHLAVNYADSGWWAQDLSSRNGSAIVRAGKEILLSPGWPVQLQCNDIIRLADSVRLAVR